MKPLLFPLMLAFVLTACAARPKITPEQIEAADCGPYPQNYKQLITASHGARLKDPSGAQYRFSEPVKGVVFKPPIHGGGVDRYGWVVEYWVNAKNSYGGYTGERHHSVIIRDGVVKPTPTKEDIDRTVDLMSSGGRTRVADDIYK